MSEFPPEILELWTECEELRAKADEAEHKFRAVQRKFDAAIGLKPWQFSPLDVHSGPAPHPESTHEALRAPARRLRLALEAAAATFHAIKRARIRG